MENSSESNKPEKKKPGRPPKPKVSTGEILPIHKQKEIVDELFDGDGNLRQHQEFKTKIMNLSSSFPTFNSEDSLEKVDLGIKNQIEFLNENLITLDESLKKATSEFNKVSEVRTFLEEQHFTLKDLIKDHQDFIIDYENDLEDIDEGQFIPEKSDFSRWMANKFFGRKDEIWLRQAITKSETIISQLQTKLVSVNEVLAKTLLAFQGQKTMVEQFETVIESYREVRMGLGKERRRFADAAKTKQTKELQQSIIQNYIEKGKMIQKLGPEILNSITENSRLISQKVQQLQIDSTAGLFLAPKLEFSDKLNEADSESET